jgi:hypothetical protein
MKQLILIERSELAALRAGATLSLTLSGGQPVLIGLENHSRRRATAAKVTAKVRSATQALPRATLAKIKSLAKQGRNGNQIAGQLRVSSSTVYKYLGKGA